MPVSIGKLIQKFQKVFKDTEPKADFTDLTSMVMLTPRIKTPKGEGVMEMTWQLEDIWISEDKLVVMISPDAAVVSHYRDRNGEIIDINQGTVIPVTSPKQKFEKGEIDKKLQAAHRRQSLK